MLEAGLIVALTMAITEVIKSELKKRIDEDRVTQIVPFIVIGLGVGLNLANAAVFAPGTPLLDAAKQGLIFAAAAAGIYSGGKAVAGKS